MNPGTRWETYQPGNKKGENKLAVARGTTMRWSGHNTFTGRLTVTSVRRLIGGDSNKILDIVLSPKTGAYGFRQGALNIALTREASQPIIATWDGNDDCAIKVVARNYGNNLDGVTRIGGVRALNIQARNSGTNQSWVKTAEINARNDSGKNVSELHAVHIRVENYGNVYTDVKGLDVELSDENTTQSQERTVVVLRTTDLSGMSAVNQVFKILHTSTNGFNFLFNFAGATGDTAVANTHSIDGHALAFIAKSKHNGVDGYIPFFAAVPS
jgi:hypothetical protein